MIKFDNSVAAISVNQNDGVVEVQWKQPPTSSEFREVLSKGVEFISENKFTKWIGDVRELGAILDEDQKWSNEMWFPKAIEAGVNKIAIVISDDVFNQLSVEEIMSKVDTLNVTSHYFSSKEEALQWVNNN